MHLEPAHPRPRELAQLAVAEGAPALEAVEAQGRCAVLMPAVVGQLVQRRDVEDADEVDEGVRCTRERAARQHAQVEDASSRTASD